MLEHADFVPPRPVLPARFGGTLALLRTSAEDMLRFFPESGFRHRLIPMRTLRRRLLVVNDPELVREVFVLHAAANEAKSPHFRQALAPVIGDSMFLNSGRVWAERRAVIARLIHPSRTAQFHPLFVEGAEALAARWRGRVDVARELAAATALAVMRALFPRTAREADAAALAAAFTAYESRVLAVDFAHLLGLPERLSGLQLRAARRHAREIRALCAAAIARALPDEGGLFAELRAACDAAGRPLLDAEQLLNEVAMLLLAGSETSANALTWALYLIARHPPTLAQLRAEHARVLGGRAPSFADLAELPFTKAVTQEAMRLYPPVPYLSREAAASLRVGQVTLHPGDTVMALPWLLHRHEQLWDAPHAFRPERFLPDAPRKPPRMGYIPFSIGPRVCAGAAFAQAEMSVFLAVLLQRLDFSAPPGAEPMPRARLTTRPRGGLVLEVTPRGARSERM
ncbi:MAG: cytochrome P450 [Roseococcus sp.]|nr:cytochrome P450 [Roseococcus sp.]